jgi:hypothetical protein
VGGGERGDVASPDDEDEVDQLVRWQDAGAVWRVVARSEAAVTVALLRCDGGEEVGRLVSSSRAWLDFLRGRESSED